LQKLGLIVALGHRPELLVLDEPVASLDPSARRDFLKSLLEVTQDLQHTVLFSTHITSDLERVASHVALLRDGRISLFDELDSVKDRFKRLRIRQARYAPKWPVRRPSSRRRRPARRWWTSCEPAGTPT
jgi:ABC-2 type transport system ATP-binding protein